MSEVTVQPTEPANPADDGYAFELSGGHLALDFTNTISRREEAADSTEYLPRYGRLVSWGLQAGLVTAKAGESLRVEARSRPRAAVAALRRAVAIREAAFSLFVAIARGEKPPAAALEAINAALPEALAALRIGAGPDGFAWRFAHDEMDLAPMLAPVVRAAAELLTSDEVVRIRECGSETCFWLFLDRSKNGTRRWCDMKVCGNRAKARRHYQREKRAARPRRRAKAEPS
jgi:predicted RNA-binding Zn ribbon-like protein